MAVETRIMSRSTIISLVAFAIVVAGLLFGALRTRGGQMAPTATGTGGFVDAFDAPEGLDRQVQADATMPRALLVEGSKEDGGASSVGSGRIVGRVELLDGSPLSDARVLVVDAAAARPKRSVLRGGPPWPREILLEAATDGGGEVRCEEADAARIDRPFRLLHLGDAAIPQDDTVYGPGEVGGIVHVLPAGRIVVHALDSDGIPVDRAAVRVERDRGAALTGFTSTDGSAVFYITSRCGFGVRAYQRERRLGACVEARVFALQSPAFVRLTLEPMDGGMVRVRVVDQEGRMVERFAVRFLDHGQLVRYVVNSGLWRGEYVLGLPEVELDVRLDRVFAEAPSMYAASKDGLKRITPTADGTAELMFEVGLGGRVAFDLESWHEGAERLQVRVTRSGPESENAWREIGVWQFTDAGASSSVGMDGDGRWYTDLIEPGTVRVEVHGADRSGPLFDQWLELAPGEIPVRAIRL